MDFFELNVVIIFRDTWHAKFASLARNIGRMGIYEIRACVSSIQQNLFYKERKEGRKKVSSKHQRQLRMIEFQQNSFERDLLNRLIINLL